MAHFPSLSDWRGILRWIATTLFALFIGTLAEENVRYVAEQEHWNEILMSGIRIMPDLHFYMETKGFWFFFGLTAGIAAALWIVRFVPEAKPKFARSLNDTQVLFNSAIEPAHEAIMTVMNAILQALRNHPNRSVQNLISVARQGATDLGQSTCGRLARAVRGLDQLDEQELQRSVGWFWNQYRLQIHFISENITSAQEAGFDVLNAPLFGQWPLIGGCATNSKVIVAAKSRYD